MKFRRYYVPGAFVSETTVGGDEWPERAYAYIEVEQDTIACHGTIYSAPEKVIEGTFYRSDRCSVQSYEEVKINPKATTILVGNMWRNNWTHIVWTPQGAFPFYPGKDRLV